MSDAPIGIGDVFSIDPTFGYTSPTWSQNVGGNAIVSGSCASGAYSSFSATNTTTPSISTGASGSSSRCFVTNLKWNTSSIPVGSTINSTTLQYDISATSSPRNCDYTQILNDWTLDSNTSKYNDVALASVNYLTNDTGCTSTGTGKTLVLGSTANTDVKNKLSSGYFNLGIKPDPFVRTAILHQSTYGNIKLQIVYNYQPTAPTLLKENTLSTS